MPHAPSEMPEVDLVSIKRALISVSDKNGIVELATTLQRQYGVALISTGGTCKALRQAGLTVADISEVTGFPEMMDGRVKTLHPLVHGALLGLRDHPEHVAAMTAHQITPIDLVIVNLYPFEQTVAKPDCTFAEAIENIDIGGPSMIRSAAKNHRSVAVLTQADQYADFLNQLATQQGQTNYTFRRRLAMEAYCTTARYDAAIWPYLAQSVNATSPEPAEVAGLTPYLTPRLTRVQTLRYGENPHQLAAFYAQNPTVPGVATAQQLHGKALSYINILDAEASIELVREFDRPAAAVIKHTNPCGCAVAGTLAEAFDLAYAGDAVAAFGGIVALNRDVDEETATRIVTGKRFLEVLIAPGYTPAALQLLQSRWKDCRILATGPLGAHRPALHYHSVTGGMLVQQTDLGGFDRASVQVVTQRQPSEAEWADLGFVWLVTKHIKSNAVAVAKGGQLLGAGAGQMSRVTSSRLAIELVAHNGHKAQLPGAVIGSDAFFPFADGPEILLSAGVTGIVQPGGSKKDQDTIDLCNRLGATMVFVGQRHFKH